MLLFDLDMNASVTVGQDFPLHVSASPFLNCGLLEKKKAVLIFSDLNTIAAQAGVDGRLEWGSCVALLQEKGRREDQVNAML